MQRCVSFGAITEEVVNRIVADVDASEARYKAWKQAAVSEINANRKYVAESQMYCADIRSYSRLQIRKHKNTKRREMRLQSLMTRVDPVVTRSGKCHGIKGLIQKI